jgi:hypothetical protein
MWLPFKGFVQTMWWPFKGFAQTMWWFLKDLFRQCGVLLKATTLSEEIL